MDDIRLQWNEGGFVLAIKKGLKTWTLKSKWALNGVGFCQKEYSNWSKEENFCVVDPVEKQEENSLFLVPLTALSLSMWRRGSPLGSSPFQPRVRSTKKKESKYWCVYDFYLSRWEKVSKNKWEKEGRSEEERGQLRSGKVGYGGERFFRDFNGKLGWMYKSSKFGAEKDGGGESWKISDTGQVRCGICERNWAWSF